MSDIEQRLREAMDGVTPGPWVAKQTVINGNEYGGWWLEGIDIDPEDATRPERLVLISGSGGARSYTTRIIDRQIHDDNEANMKWFALCSPDNIGALLDTIASLRSKLEEAEGARGSALVATPPAEPVVEALRNDIRDIVRKFEFGSAIAEYVADEIMKLPALATKPAVKDDETVVEAAHKALVAGKMLLENSIGCAVNHYGDDYYIHGEPGWLADCRKDLEALEAALAAKDGRS
jgi:hypothetical protein